MTTKEQLEKYFQRDTLIDIFVRYEIYFHMGLGRLVYLSIQDIEDTYKKLDELNLQIDTNIVINALYNILLHYSSDDIFQNTLDYHIRASAMSQALEEFISKDKELINPKLYAEKMHNEIFNDTIFTDELKQQFELEYKEIYPFFENSITKEMVEHIYTNVLLTYEQSEQNNS